MQQLSIVGTEHLLRRAIENVVRNAVHYTGENTTVSVEMRVEPGKDCGIAGAGVKDIMWFDTDGSEMTGARWVGPRSFCAKD